MPERTRGEEIIKKGIMKGFEYQDPTRHATVREIENRIRAVTESFGFVEIEGPLLQPIEFYQVKSGDDLLQHTYAFEDADGSVLVLAPEFTPTVAYMVAKDDARLRFPLKWWANPTLFRKEKPQKGRKRQFKQLNVDIFDRMDSNRERAYDDVEIISLAISIFESFGLDEEDIVMRVNSRSLIEKVFDTISLDSDQRTRALALIDRKLKIPEEDFRRNLEGITHSPVSTDTLLRWLSLESIQEVVEIEEFRFLKETTEYRDLMKVFDLISACGKSGYCEFSPYIVRGLGYYTGTVFEAYDRENEFKRSLMGGGRYDDLTKHLGGKIPITGVGFGFGNVPLEEILALRNIEITKTGNEIDYYIVIQTEENRISALQIAERLRKRGLKVVIDDSIAKDKPDKVNKQLSKANRYSAKNCIIVFPDEWSRNEVIVKDMQTGDQKNVRYESFE